MSNDRGNSRIADYGKKSRFGTTHNCPLIAQQKASPPWSIINTIRRICAAEINLEKPITLSGLSKIIAPDGKSLTCAQTIAVATVYRAIKGSFADSQYVVKCTNR
jgi:hypothetical protein